jgi:hypothetical protein
MSELATFWSICAAAKEKLDVTFNAPDLVPYGAKLVELVVANPSKRAEFTGALVEAALDPRKCDPWVVEFCAHALRWPELRDRFVELHSAAIHANNWSREPVLRYITEAFEEDWENASDFYGSYFKPPES